jgi:hypothetical protein
MADVFIQRTAGQVQSRLLAQYELDRTADVFDTIYTVGTGIEVKVKSVYICKRTSGAGAFRLCHDEAGTTYDTSNALYYDKTVTANDTFTICSEFYMLEGDSLGMSSTTADVFTVSIYGEEIQTRAR